MSAGLPLLDQPRRLESLWDMINCTISGIGQICAGLLMETVLRTPCDFEDPDGRITEEDIKRTNAMLELVISFATQFELASVQDRVSVVKRKLDLTMRHGSLANECRVLRETIDFGLKNQLVYRYPREQGELLQRWLKDWEAVLEKFPSAKVDIFAATDLWAMGHFTASVFHSMRILEHGLRALARDVGLSFDIQNWQNIIDQIEAAIRGLAKSLPRGSEKNESLQFLSSAAKEFSYFKDGWRNYVSHSKGVYDVYQARGVLEHARSFMTTLSSRLSEVDDVPDCEG
jgi:hypothetical protein